MGLPFGQNLPDEDELVQLVSQQTIDVDDSQKIERLTYKVWGVNNRVRKRRARRWTRANSPTAINFLRPTTETEQSTFRDFFDNSIDAEFGQVEVVVVKPIL